MQVMNPRIVVTKTFFKRLFGYRYNIRLDYAVERYSSSSRWAEDRTAMHSTCKTREDVEIAIARIRSKVSGTMHIRVNGADWREDD